MLHYINADKLKDNNEIVLQAAKHAKFLNLLSAYQLTGVIKCIFHSK